MADEKMDTKAVLESLNGILEMELAGMVRYTHYSLMIFGHSRIPIVSWFREQASESLNHAHEAGERVTALGGKPSLAIGKLLTEHKNNIDDILREMLAFEREGIALYQKLLDLVADRSVHLEEYARGMVHNEESDASEIEKMLRRMK